MPDSRDAQIAAVAAIHDPQRRALFDYVRQSVDAVSRDAAASALGMPRSTAAFHLDRLVEEGLLDIEFRRLSGRTGPGAGRPSKLYRWTDAELTVSIPARRYELVGGLLAAAVDEADRSGRGIREVLTEVADDTGRTLGATTGSLDATLEGCGYEPRDDGAGALTLTNCPFRQLAATHTEVICQTNLALLGGVADGAGDDRSRVEFAPSTEGYCCVRILSRP